jgi:hypothetical protein
MLTYSQQLGYIINALRKGFQIIKKNKIDIIHANTYSPIISAVILGKMFKIPVVSTVHHVTLGQWKLWSSQEKVQRSTSLIGPVYEKLVLKMPVQTVHVVSHATKDDLIRVNPGAKVVTIYNGINPDNYNDLSTTYEYQDFILYIGRLVVTKNLQVVILAFKQVVLTFPHAKLIVVGDGPMRSEWEQLVRKNGLETNVIFMGYVFSNTKQELLRSCTALVLPSKLEGFGRVIIEAFAMYKPVLASKIEAATEVVDDNTNGFLIPSDDVDTWVDRIKFLLSNKENCRAMGINGRKKVIEKFDLASNSKKIEELYKNVIADRK